jgi:hypothetical protein
MDNQFDVEQYRAQLDALITTAQQHLMLIAQGQFNPRVALTIEVPGRKPTEDEALVMEAYDFGRFSAAAIGLIGMPEKLREALCRVLEQHYTELYSAAGRVVDGADKGLCRDEGCPHHGTPHVCLNLSDEDREKLLDAITPGQDPVSLAAPRDKSFRKTVLASQRKVTPEYYANTIYVVATDGYGKPVVYGTRSTFTPHEDELVMTAALEFEQAKRLRNVEIPAHKVGQLWMTTLPPVVISHDFYTHRDSWRKAVEERIKEMAYTGMNDADDRAYWEHELEAFDRTFATLPPESKDLRIFVPEVLRNRVLAETTIQAQKIAGDADLLASLNALVTDKRNAAVAIYGRDDGVRIEILPRDGGASNAREYLSTSFHQAIGIAAEKEGDKS